jgi:hypothetical protein
MKIKSDVPIVTLRVSHVDGLYRLDRKNHYTGYRGTMRFLSHKELLIMLRRTVSQDLKRFDREEGVS